MDPMTRRSFFSKTGGLSALAILPRSTSESATSSLPWPGGEVENAAFRLILSPREGLRKTGVVHVPSGLVLADADYSYSFERPQFRESRVAKSDDGSVSVHLQGTAADGSLEIVQEFRLPHGKPWFEEEVTLVNRGSVPLDLSSARCGFVLPLARPAAKVDGRWKEFKFTAIPYRREPQGNKSQYFDFSLDQILTEEFRSELMTYETRATPLYASEGWAWTDGKLGFLITKYSQQGMEWAVLDRVPLGRARAGLRWGGLGIYLGEPEHGAWLPPGESHRFGVTRFTAYQGGMVEGFYAFREEMTERGHGCPQGFNPPVHWNELYDNKLWWLPDEQQGDPEMRKKYYTLAAMKEEAAKAQAIGCEALYLDPGWDTLFGSKIWGEARLGSCESFVDMLRRDYGLKLALHTPLSGWCDPTAYPPELYRMDRLGQRLTWDKTRGFVASPLCGASRGYVEETARRLKALARAGAIFFMFDGNGYHAECWDPQHGHSVPAQREEHVQGMCRLARMVHAEYPHVLIEMHGPTPTYYGHGRAPEGAPSSQALGFDSVWAFELMWDPIADLQSGRSIVLYYYSLAYGLPLYIHIDLRTDNQNALVFWWNASTCRHLGIGGTHKDAAVQSAHKEAMATYRRLEPFFKAGTFYGVEETVHVHVHPTEQAAVINCFNLEEQPTRREVEFTPGKFGLDAKRAYTITGVPAGEIGNGYTLIFDVPALAHRLAEVRAG
jgi:hypothetical protein